MKMFANYLLFACEGLMCCVIETYHTKSFAGEQEVLRKHLLFYCILKQEVFCLGQLAVSLGWVL